MKGFLAPWQHECVRSFKHIICAALAKLNRGKYNRTTFYNVNDKRYNDIVVAIQYCKVEKNYLKKNSS